MLLNIKEGNNISTRTKFNVDKDISKRTYNGIIFDSILEMKYYRDVLCPLVKSGDVVSYELQKPYELQPKFVHNNKTVQPIKYVADFFIVYKDGHEEVIDTKGCPDSVAILKRKLFWYHYPAVDYKWICYSKIDGGGVIMSMSKNNVQNEKEVENKYSVYIHINKVNGKKYVGITSRKPEVRWQNGTAYKRNPHFNAAIQKYSWSNFEHVILHSKLSYEDACMLERKYIKELNLKNNKYGYNMTDGGEGVSGFIYTDEQREKKRINNVGENNPCFGRTGSLHPMFGKRGELNPNFGRKATDEQRRNISEGRKGIKFSEKHLLHMKESARRGSASPVSRAVNMYDKNKIFIKTFDTITDGANYVGGNVSNIINCCKHKTKSSMGYVWEYVQ